MIKCKITHTITNYAFYFMALSESDLYKSQEAKMMDFSWFFSRWGYRIKSSTGWRDAKDSTAVNSIEVGIQPDSLRTIFRHCADRWYLLSHPPVESLPRVDESFKIMFNKRSRIL